MRSRRQSVSHVGLDSGASFQRARAFDIIETAKIIAVASDAVGIPHVRYSLKVAGPRAAIEEQRTLSLESFRRLYPQPVPARG